MLIAQILETNSAQAQLLAANQSQSAQATGGATLRLEALERQLQELQRRLDALE